MWKKMQTHKISVLQLIGWSNCYWLQSSAEVSNQPRTNTLTLTQCRSLRSRTLLSDRHSTDNGLKPSGQCHSTIFLRPFFVLVLQPFLPTPMHFFYIILFFSFINFSLVSIFGHFDFFFLFGKLPSAIEFSRFYQRARISNKIYCLKEAASANHRGSSLKR